MRVTNPAACGDTAVMNVMIGVEHDGNDFLLEQSQISLKIIALTADQLRGNDLGFIEVLVVVVVLDERQRAVQSRARNEGGAHPVVNLAMRNFDRPFTRPELRDNLSGLDLLGSLRIFIRPQKSFAARQILFHDRFCIADVGSKPLQCLRFQKYGSDR